ncbi:MAG: DUF3089 domain-containing protein [Saprospiraceae bacterium]|nr:DUF3089 domain-containing protein [Saprospiraceae bacterium]
MSKKLIVITFFLLSFFQFLFAQDVKNIDYSNPDNWAALPQKRDNADLIPGNIGTDLQGDSKVDVFFVYPTSYTNALKDGKWNADIDDIQINNETDENSIKYQASLFNQVGKIYAPRYRQAHISVYFTANRDTALKALDFAYQDVKSAFDYYIHNYNQGRPFIIASHSQGTTHAIRLIKECIEGKSIEKQMVVAYLAGMPLDSGYLATPACDFPDQFHCTCSWRTFIHDYTPEYVTIENTTIVTNPISWLSNTDYTAWKEHKGAVLKDFKKVRPGIISAKRAGNILWIKEPKIKGFRLLKIKNFHIGDYNLFYKDIQENAILRSNAFLKSL